MPEKESIGSDSEVPSHFDLVLAFPAANPVATANMVCHLSANEIYG